MGQFPTSRPGYPVGTFAAEQKNTENERKQSSYAATRQVAFGIITNVFNREGAEEGHRSEKLGIRLEIRLAGEKYRTWAPVLVTPNITQAEYNSKFGSNGHVKNRRCKITFTGNGHSDCEANGIVELVERSDLKWADPSKQCAIASMGGMIGVTSKDSDQVQAHSKNMTRSQVKGYIK